ncbi:MAG TPA: ATP-binding cassette domain-containing protein [Steroidobacteraceae bacterium]|jgi:molybdate transport system ATP-binding protein
MLLDDRETSSDERDVLIELSHCSLILDDHKVLDDINFTLRRGERWALIGPNGAGKTLLLKMLRGDVWPTPDGRERVRFALGASPLQAGAGHKQLIAYVGPERQDKYVRYGWNLTVAEVVTTGLFDEDIPLTRPARTQRERVARVLRRFGLWSLRERRMLTLSYGQRRLALVARAFASEAPVLLLDEVFNGLDEKTKHKLRRSLERPRGGHAWILSSHRPKELPANVTHIARIEAGRVVSLARVRASNRPGTSHVLRALEKPRSADRRRFELSPESPQTSRSARGPWLVRIRNANVYRDYRPVIRQLDWTIHKGEHWAVLGANGSGKSTLLSLLYGDLHPALGGTIERRDCPPGTRIEEWKRRTGWVSPELQADSFLAGSLEDIVVSGRYSSVGLDEPATKADRRAATRWMKFFGIEGLRARKPRQLSYGQMRLALLARAMINEPRLLLLDEPCTGLDADTRVQVLNEIERLARNGTQIIMAVHDPEDIVPSVRNVLRIRPGGRVELGSMS